MSNKKSISISIGVILIWFIIIDNFQPQEHSPDIKVGTEVLVYNVEHFVTQDGLECVRFNGTVAGISCNWKKYTWDKDKDKDNYKL